MTRLLGLALLGLLGGIGITAIGPGGVLPTIGLFALTALSPARIAGTAIVTHVCTGILGTVAYARSGQLRDPGTRRIAWLLAGTAAVGTPLGVLVNTTLSHTAAAKRVFGLLLAVLVVVVAVLVVWRERGQRSGTSRPVPDRRPSGLGGGGSGGDGLGGDGCEGDGSGGGDVPGDDVPGGDAPGKVGSGGDAGRGPAGARGPVAVLGTGVALAAGVVGIGGPMLSVPLLVALGVPVLSALAAAQVESIVIAGVGTAGYLVTGGIDWRLAVLIGVPELAGVLIGWRIARALPTRVLRVALVVSLLGLAPYLALHT